MDGIVKMSENFREELPTAVREILAGNLWAPADAVAEYVRCSSLLLEKQIHPDLALTARENQILQLVIRRFCNKEIANVLGISERTVKFHVSNIFTKLGVKNRRSLLQTMGVGLQANLLPS
jgi:DNA-binding NarL/FixJ family response regulator